MWAGRAILRTSLVLAGPLLTSHVVTFCVTKVLSHIVFERDDMSHSSGFMTGLGTCLVHFGGLGRKNNRKSSSNLKHCQQFWCYCQKCDNLVFPVKPQVLYLLYFLGISNFSYPLLSQQSKTMHPFWGLNIQNINK